MQGACELTQHVPSMMRWLACDCEAALAGVARAQAVINHACGESSPYVAAGTPRVNEVAYETREIAARRPNA